MKFNDEFENSIFYPLSSTSSSIPLLLVDFVDHFVKATDS